MDTRCYSCTALTKCIDDAKSGRVVKCPFFGELSAVITCRNCTFYHDTLEGDDGFHLHDYCSIWKAQIPNSIIFDRLGLDHGYDDIECGLARCWAFEMENGNIQTKFPKNDSRKYVEEK